MLQIITIVVLLMHGLGQIMPFLASWTNVKLFSDRSWLFSPGVPITHPIGKSFGLLGVVAMLGFVAGAVGLMLGQAWWQPMAIAAAVISLVVAIPWVRAWPPMNVLGNIVVDVAVLVVLLTPLGDAYMQAL